MSATWVDESGNFKVTVKMVYDSDSDLSWLGRFSNGGDNAIPREFVGRGEYSHFVPAISEAEHIEGGATPAEAAEYVRQDMAMLESYGDSWFDVGIIVTLEFRHKIESSDSLWGVYTSIYYSESESELESTVAELYAGVSADMRESLVLSDGLTVPELTDDDIDQLTHDAWESIK